MPDTPKKFRERMCRRTRQIREDLRYDRVQFAKLLGVTYAAMQRYEERTPMPPHVIERFCLVTGYDPWYVLTGRPNFEAEVNDPSLDLIEDDPTLQDRRAHHEAKIRRTQRRRRHKTREKSSR